MSKKRKIISNLFFILITSLFDVESLIRRLEKKINVHGEEKDFLQRNHVDLIFSSTVIYEQLDLDFIKAAAELKIPSLQFVASWDNMTSKGFFVFPADKILVWGEVDVEAGIKEHQLDPNKMVITGPPHFDMYFGKNLDIQAFLKERSLPGDAKILLFAGTTFNKLSRETDLVGKLAHSLKDEGIIVWYRPHPRNADLSFFKKLQNSPNIYFDDFAIKKSKKGDSSFDTEQGSLEVYPYLLEICFGVVTVFSTMSLEFSLKGKPSFNVNFYYDEIGNERSPITVSTGEHLKNLQQIDLVNECNSFHELIMSIKTSLSDKTDNQRAILQAMRISYSEGNSRRRIVDIINDA